MKESQERVTHIIGIKSKLAEYLLNHPWQSMAAIYVVSMVVTFLVGSDFEKQIRATQIVLPILIVVTVIMRYVHRNTCFRIIIDTRSNSLILHRFFNKGVVGCSIKDIKILIDRNFNIVINKNKYKIINEYFDDLAALLPRDTEIKFLGYLGKSVEKEWQNIGRTYPFWPR